MGCTSCSTKSGVPNGCKSNGNCATGSCDKLTVFDWLSNMALPSGQKPLNIVEVRFKNGRKHFFRNTNSFHLSMGEVVAVEGSPGHDIGTVSLTGELVRVQMKKKKVSEDSEEVKKIYRKASVRDIEIWQTARDKETETQRRGREILGRLGLKMKLSDVEYQGDGNKATFYYTAEDRVDFRMLIKDLASAFSVRVEMKQVGLRQEAARLGGVGSCGRELCCSTWLTDFRKVNTAAARYQQLSLNPQKLAGQCGKLKCCLNFELDSYLDALKGFPKQDLVLETEKGKATFVKMDIFKGLVWYASREEGFKWFKLTLEQVQEVIEMNKNGEKSPSLEDLESETVVATKIDFENVVGQDSLTRFDKPKVKSKRRNKKKKPEQGQGQPNTAGPKKPAQGPRKPGNPNQKKEGNPNSPQGNKNPNQKPRNTNPNGKGVQGNKNPNQKPRNTNLNAKGVEGNKNPNQKPNPNANGPKQGAPKKRRPQNKNKPNPNATPNVSEPKAGTPNEEKQGVVKAEGATAKPKRNNNRRRKPNNDTNKPDTNANKDA